MEEAYSFIFTILFCRYSIHQHLQRAILTSVGSTRALAMKDVLPQWQQPSLYFLKLGMDIIMTWSFACQRDALTFFSSASVETSGRTEGL